jgi:hypothetical protein
MKKLQKIIAGDDFRPSRFHDMKGNRVNFAKVAMHLPRSLVSYVAERSFGYRSPTPWIPYGAQRAIRDVIAPDWRVVEFGSGMSTSWLARRCGFLHSIESDEKWFRLVSEHLATAKNVRYECRRPEVYADLQEYPNGTLDFALIDGIRRAQCVTAVVPKLRSGGWLYLDNSDADSPAEEEALRALALRNGSKLYFTDFCPRLLHPNEGLLIQLDT